MSVIVSGLPGPVRADEATPRFVLIEAATGQDGEKAQAPAKRPAPGRANPRGLRHAPPSLLGQDLGGEAEPNDTSATATPLAGDSTVVRANVFPANDVDLYSFAGTAGDRVYAALQTLSDASASGDSVLDVLDTDGTTVIESDPNDGTFNASSSTVAGTTLGSTGTFFLRVRHNVATGTIRPYHLQFNKVAGTPVPEVEPNNTPATANPVPASGWISGDISAVSPGESDFFSLNLNAGDSVYLSLDMNPERDVNVWNGRLGFALFGNPPANQILLANDANAGANPADPNSEAFFFTVLAAGTYFIYVDSIVATGLGVDATYHLSVAVRPAQVESCTTYTSTDVPQTIPTGPGSVSSTLTIPGNPRIADLDVTLNLNHTFMQDLDVHLISPAGNDNGIFTDIGAATVGGAQTLMDLRIDDEAALPFAFALSAGMVHQPELAYRLNWFDGADAGGTWTLQIRDDATGDGGTLNAWSLTVCEPPPPPTCGPGLVPVTVFSTDFESGDAGFTHSGVLDEWERGLPATSTTFTTCNSGVNCWKTDLDDTYNASSSQDLLSPNINLAGLSAPVTVTWAQRYHLESATFDHVAIDAREVGGAGATVRLFDWLDATMNNTVGSGPAVTIAETSGWSVLSRRADSLAGLNSELRFHLDSDTTVQLGGLAIDDVSVTACQVASADLAITKTDGVTSAVPGGSTTYTITASNAGPDAVTGATVADTFPAVLTCTWTCVGAGGGTCTAAGAGNINDSVDLPAGASVTYTASCTIASSATGSLSNTATVASAVADPNPANNAATDTDTLTPEADLAITKTDGQTTVQAGGPITYTIVASNSGPSDAPGSTVTDTVDPIITGATWTCVGAGGGTCTAAGAGNINDTINLPAGSSVTYTLSGTVDASALGSLSNTATVAAPAGVTDPNPGNNSATDTNTIVGMAYFAVTPCRVVDTRGGAPIGGPVLQGQQTRTFAVTGNCGIPATARALAVIATVTQPTAEGNVRLFAGGLAVPSTSTINYVAGRTRANNAIVSLNGVGEMAAFVAQPAGTTTHLIIDVVGYFQ